MGGRPTITFDVPVIEGRIGESFIVTPHISADDPLVERLGIYDIHWESSDESVATVTQNADGTITVVIVGAGSVSINARFGESPLDEFVARAGVGVSGTGTGTGDGDGDGDGSGSGSGDGSGTGDGDGSGDGSGSGDGAGDGDGSGDGGDPDGDGAGTGSGGDGDDSGGPDPDPDPDPGGDPGGDPTEEGNKVDVTGGGQADDDSDDPDGGEPPEGGAILIEERDEGMSEQSRADEPALGQDDATDEPPDTDPLIDAAVTSSLPATARLTRLRLLSASEALGFLGSAGGEGGGGGGGGGDAPSGIVAGFMVNAADDGRVLIYLLVAALCLAFGSARRIGSYQLAKDHIAAKAAKKERRPAPPVIPSAAEESYCARTEGVDRSKNERRPAPPVIPSAAEESYCARTEGADRSRNERRPASPVIPSAAEESNCARTEGVDRSKNERKVR
jgi:hypothetical protein